MNASVAPQPSESGVGRDAAVAPPEGAASKDKGGTEDTRPAKQGEKQDESSKLDQGPAKSEANIYGGNFPNANFFAGAGRTEQRLSWAAALRRIDRSDCAGGADDPDPIFDAARAAWLSHRIVVLRHQQGALDRAECLLHRLSYWASSDHTELWGVANDAMLPLGDLAAHDAWPTDAQAGLVLLQRRHDQKTTLFFSSNNGVGVKALRERLTERNSRLLITVAAEWDAGEGRLDPFDKSVKTFEVTSLTQAAQAAPAKPDESAFDAVPRIVASLFEGLGVDEFKALVDELLVGMTAPAPAAPPLSMPGASAATSASSPPPTPPTRHARWLSGEVDGVLAELGVRYTVAATDLVAAPGRARSAGYGLAESAGSYAEPGWVIAHHPALLGRRAHSLLDRYLSHNDASARFCEAFLSTLARLDSADVRPVTAEWLLDAWRRALTQQAEPGWIGARLFALIEYLSSDSHDAMPRLATAVIDALARHAVEQELEFQLEVAQPLQEALARGEAESLAQPAQLWPLLLAMPASQAATQRFAYRQTASLWALLLLARRWPRPVAVALARVLDETTDAATPWCQAAPHRDTMQQVPRQSALALNHLLALAASDLPEVWTAVSAGVVQAFEADVQACLASIASDRSRRVVPQASRDRAVQGQRLAFLCLYSVSPQVYAEAQQHCALRRLKLIGQPEGQAGDDAGLIGRLLAIAHLDVAEVPMLGPAGLGVLPALDIVRFLRAMALGLQDDDEVTPQQGAEVLSRAASGLRDVLPLALRRALRDSGRESLEGQQRSRDDFESQGDRDSMQTMRRRIRATQAVLRSLSGG